jgi:AraC-like DNA-binding protein
MDCPHGGATPERIVGDRPEGFLVESCRFQPAGVPVPCARIIILMKAGSDVSEWTQFFRCDGAAPIFALHAGFRFHRYARHSHEYLVIGLVEAGVQSYTYRGARHLTSAGQMFIVNADEPHTGEAATDAGYVYRTLCIGEAAVRDMTRDLLTSDRTHHLKGAIIADSDLVSGIRKVHRSLIAGAPRLEIDVLLRDAVSQIYARYSDTRVPTRDLGRAGRAVSKAQEYIEENFSANLSLQDLSQVAGLSPYHLSRSFTRVTGLPPHTYLDKTRLRRVRELLDRGEPIAAAAVAVGYVDQSHLTHRFKRTFGITPRQYVQSRQITRLGARECPRTNGAYLGGRRNRMQS